jgi:tRNA (adenine22-N1)-methyltransferase
MQSLNLSPRLSAAARYVIPNMSTADIGTDHAYLAAYLIQSGALPHIFASDINKGPLETAKETAERYSVSDKITLRLSDGLQAYKSGEVEQIIICGMGGELISQILSGAPWVLCHGVHLILQPMSKPDFLRRFLCRSGFEIDSETAVFDSGRYYSVISAYYSGNKTECDEVFAQIGALVSDKSEAAAGYKKLVCRRFEKKITGLKKQNKDSSKAESLEKIKREIEETI